MKMKMNNIEVRELIEKKRIAYYEVASALGINVSTLSRWLREELDEEHKARVMKAIKSIKI